MTRRAWEREYRERGRLWRGVRLDAATAELLTAQPALRQARWLEAGCGDGKGLVPLAAALAPEAPPVVGLDASRWALRRSAQSARERLPGVPPRVALVRGDVGSPPFPAAYFGAVRAVHVLGHLRAPDRAHAAAALAGLVAPEGWLVASEFGSEDFRAGSGERVEAGTVRRGVGVETHYFEAGELARLVTAAGIAVVAARPERFHVTYGGKRLLRHRWDVVARRSG